MRPVPWNGVAHSGSLATRLRPGRYQPEGREDSEGQCFRENPAGDGPLDWRPGTSPAATPWGGSWGEDFFALVAETRGTSLRGAPGSVLSLCCALRGLRILDRGSPVSRPSGVLEKRYSCSYLHKQHNFVKKLKMCTLSHQLQWAVR